jgi:hypothetical protein
MTPDEFAALPSAVHHAAWLALAERRIDAARWATGPGSILVYNRAQVLGLLAETAVTR